MACCLRSPEPEVMLLGFRSQVVGLDRIGAPFDDCFAAGWKTAQGRLVENGSGIGAAPPGRLRRDERSPTATMTAVHQVATGGKMIASLAENVTVGHEPTLARGCLTVLQFAL